MSEKLPSIGYYDASNQQSPKETAISNKEFQSLETIAKIVGGDFGMQVKVGETGKGSFFNPDECSITFDPSHINENLAQARFVAGHEGSHRAISISPTKMGLPARKVAELYSQTGFGFLQNSIEDPAVNDWLSRKFPGLKSDIKENYDGNFMQENVVLGTPETAQIAQQLGYYPKFAHFGSEIIRFWHQGRFSQILDSDVQDALSRTISFAQKSISTIPDPEVNDKKSTLNTAQNRFKINTEKIWPVMKKLVEMDINNESLRKMLEEQLEKIKELLKKDRQMNDAQNSGDSEMAEQLGQEKEEVKKNMGPLGELPEETLKDILKKIQESTRQSDKNITDSQESQQNNESSHGSQGEPQHEKRGNQSGGLIPGNQEGMPFPVDNLPEEIAKALKDAFDKLPSSKKEELRQKAKKQLDELEDALNKDLEGKLNGDRPQNHQEQEESQSSKENKLHDAAKITKRNQEQETAKKLESFRQELMTAYEKTRGELLPMIDDLYYRLRLILKPQEENEYEYGFPTGRILDYSRTMQANENVSQKHKLWIRETEPQKKDYRFWHLIDLSGSMHGEPLQQTYKGFVIAAEAIDRIEDLNGVDMTVRQGITGFDDKVYQFKSFEQRFTTTIESELAKMPNTGGGGTNTLEATRHALDEMKKKQGESANFILTFTDGSPNYDVRDELKSLIKETIDDRKRSKTKIGIIWLGNDISEEQINSLVEEYGYDFGLALPAIENKEKQSGRVNKSFQEKLGDLIETLVKYPEAEYTEIKEALKQEHGW